MLSIAILSIWRPSETGDIANRRTAVCARCGTCITILVYNGVMPASNKIVRQTVGLPADTARRVRSLAKQRRLSANRIIVELVEEGIEAQKRKQKEFFELAERYRVATDPKDVARLGDDLGRMVFGD
jgi:predicted transcriptional regulator